MSEEEASVQVRREFGDVQEARRSLSEMDERGEYRRRRREWLVDLRQDLPYALRSLRKNPGSPRSPYSRWLARRRPCAPVWTSCCPSSAVSKSGYTFPESTPRRYSMAPFRFTELPDDMPTPFDRPGATS